MDTVEAKKQARAGARRLKALLDEGQRREASDLIKKRVEALPAFAAASTVLLYCSLPDEVDTSAMISDWSAAKRLILPRVVGNGLDLCFYDPSCLAAGYRGILEPSLRATVVAPSVPELAIIPGMAFDVRGSRLGRGGGFYDRLLPLLDCPTVGICFSCQILESVPSEIFDRRVDMVITENNSYLCVDKDLMNGREQ